MDAIVMCIKSGAGEACIGESCPLPEKCFPEYKMLICLNCKQLVDKCGCEVQTVGRV